MSSALATSDEPMPKGRRLIGRMGLRRCGMYSNFASGERRCRIVMATTQHKPLGGTGSPPLSGIVLGGVFLWLATRRDINESDLRGGDFTLSVARSRTHHAAEASTLLCAIPRTLVGLAGPVIFGSPQPTSSTAIVSECRS